MTPRTIFLALILFWTAMVCAITNGHCATIYYDTTAQGTGTGASEGNEKAWSAMVADYAAGSCGDTFSVKAGATLTDNTDFITWTKTGCTSGSKIQFVKHGTGANPILDGDWTPSSADSGDVAIKMASNVDYHEWHDIDIKQFRVIAITGTTNHNGLSTSNDGTGLSNNIVFEGAAFSEFQTGIIVYGAPNASCGASHATCDDNANLPAGTSGAWSLQNLTFSNFSLRAILVRNGAGDANSEGASNGITIQSVSCNGGGATYDVSGSQQGQGCIDIGLTSGTGTGTPDSNFLIEDVICQDLNNRQHGSEPPNKNGDCIKTEPETNNITIRRVSCTGIIDSCVDSKSVNADIYDSVCAKSTHCWKSYSSVAAGRQTRFHNVLCHNVNNPGGTQASHSVQTFGDTYFENATNINLEENSTSHFKFQADFGDSSITWEDSFSYQDGSYGTSLTNSPGIQYSSTCNATNTCTWVTIANGTTVQTAVYPTAVTVDNTSPFTSGVIMYDSEGGTTNGIDPGFGTMDPDYYLVSDLAGCLPFEPTNAAYAGIGFRCINPSNPFVVPNAPTGLNATTVSSSAIDLSWIAPTLDTNQPFVEAYIVERSSGGAYSTVTTISGEDLTNGTMEAGTGSWSLHDTEGAESLVEETTTVYAGSKSIEVVVDAHDEGVKQNITVADGTACNCSAFVYIPSGTFPDDVKVYAKEEGSDFTPYNSTAATKNNEWELITVPFTKGSDSNQLRFSVSASTPATATVNFFVDNASCVCGEPSTTYSDTGLTAATTYTYRVSSRNSIGTGDPSATDSDTTSGGQSTENPRLRGCSFRGISFR